MLKVCVFCSHVLEVKNEDHATKERIMWCPNRKCVRHGLHTEIYATETER